MVNFLDFIDPDSLKENPFFSVPEGLSFEKELAELPRLDGIDLNAIAFNAGFADSYNRFELLYNFNEATNKSPISIPFYQNPHCRELDFFEIFGLGEIREKTRLPEEFEGEAITLTLNDFLYLVFFQIDFFQPGNRYEIKMNNFQHHVAFRNLVRLLKIDQSKLYTQLKFTRKPGFKTPFATETQKVVVHLRRGDVVGSVVDPTVKYGQRSPKAQGLSTHRLLKVKELPRVFEALELQGPVEVVLVSDGIMPQTKHRYAKDERITRAFEELERELTEEEISYPDTRVVGRVIGRGPEETYDTMTLMYDADYLITLSSSFPRLICRLGETEYVNLKNHPKAKHALEN
ncbi:hypothetical protein ACTL6U_05710 [Rhodovibrionaceae bacterium A322]